jgi:Tfp pilus assembly protein PilF
VSRTLDDVPEEVEARDALNLLSACVVNPGEKSPKVTQFAGAAQRVLLDDRARVYVALELISEESPRAAMSLLNSVLDDRPGVGVSSYCWQNLGVSQHRLGDLGAALESYERASLLGEARPGPLLSAFSVALAVEDVTRAERYSRELEDQMGADHPGFDEELQLLRQLTSSEAKSLKIMRENTFKRLKDRLGIVGQRIGNALIE